MGYGDVVLPLQWRMMALIQELNGILMCGLFTGFFLGVVSRLHERARKFPRGDAT